jgi:pimeloyl-ACP methyl ester carboxylesterase
VRALLALGAIVLAEGCRAAPPLPPSAVYPAGTALRARYVRLEGSRIRYVDAGNGPAVIFLHGLGASIYTWRHTLGPVERAGFRVLAFDNRGFGLSDKPPSGYSNADYVRILGAFMDSLRLPDAVLVGHSMGGEVAAEFAIAHPERVHGLVLIDAAGLGGGAPLLLRIAGWPLMGRLISGLRTRWVTGQLLRWSYADPRKVRPEDIDQYYTPVADPDFGRALRGVLREFRFDALRGRLGVIGVPTLVLWGSEDRWISPRIGRALARELPRVAWLLVAHAGHVLPEEEPTETNRLLIAFLTQAFPIPHNLALR